MIILSLIVIDAKIVLFTVIISFIFYLTASISTKKYNDFYGKIIFESRTIIIKVIQESLGFIRQIILDDSYKLFIDEYDQNKKKFDSRFKFNNCRTNTKIFNEALVLSVLVIAIAFIFSYRADFYGYITIFEHLS